MESGKIKTEKNIIDLIEQVYEFALYGSCVKDCGTSYNESCEDTNCKFKDICRKKVHIDSLFKKIRSDVNAEFSKLNQEKSDKILQIDFSVDELCFILENLLENFVEMKCPDHGTDVSFGEYMKAKEDLRNIIMKISDYIRFYSKKSLKSKKEEC